LKLLKDNIYILLKLREKVNGCDITENLVVSFENSTNSHKDYKQANTAKTVIIHEDYTKINLINKLFAPEFENQPNFKFNYFKLEYLNSFFNIFECSEVNKR
jgi:hypothetical protein